MAVVEWPLPIAKYSAKTEELNFDFGKKPPWFLRTKENQICKRYLPQRTDLLEDKLSKVDMIAISQEPPISLEKQLSAAIVHHPHLYQRRVMFRADNGHVILQGRVRSFFEKQLAQEALRSIQGVTSIDNQLEVSWNDFQVDA